ncbi:hypothetical protein BDM02DRAFT_3125803 [Thelephora ganbajun]|uniref:Uncharacterized protein n=1 Tax=Thelephora ganbajun TaxID=370292 RepID=A0ACB6ZU72_THEGA|nr:hypothetical protein BDM02DRAFT_3125803 [Thelephora ganbajun]
MLSLVLAVNVLIFAASIVSTAPPSAADSHVGARFERRGFQAMQTLCKLLQGTAREVFRRYMTGDGATGTRPFTRKGREPLDPYELQKSYGRSHGGHEDPSIEVDRACSREHIHYSVCGL